MRILRILITWIGILAYLIFVLSFVSDRLSTTVCEKISVSIKDSLDNSFISRADVMDILLHNDEKILGYALSKINTSKLEELLIGESFIKEAELYKTVNGVLNVEINQRKPLLRIINRTGKSYYLDYEGVILPKSEKFTSRVLVGNGYISEPFIPESTRSIFDYEIPGGDRNPVIYDLFSIARFISESELWRAQIAQVYVNGKYEYELIPRVGAHIIHLGDAQNLEEKFSKLEALYLLGLNNSGWNNYEIINLKYKNQVVCTKR
jgi:cell division protein FtsQ